MFGSPSHFQFAPAWEFFQRAEHAANYFAGLAGETTLDPYQAPLVRGTPEFGNGIRQLRAQAFVEFDDPTTGLRRALTVAGDFTGDTTLDELEAGLFAAAGEMFANSPPTLTGDFDFKTTDPTLTLNWIVRRF
ncbi:MAG: hypothetical protein ACTSRN_04775 [Alphaproteobacteria bacterium]